jgi:hypothetical protein
MTAHFPWRWNHIEGVMLRVLVHLVLDQHSELEFYSASSLKQQSVVDMSLHSDTLFRFRTNQSLLFFHHAVCLAEKQTLIIMSLKINLFLS